MHKQGDRYFVLILRYGHLDKLIYSPPHPGRGLKVSSDYCQSIEGCGVLKLTHCHGHQNYGPQLLGWSQGVGQ